jgi:nucleotidyltransferase substrate binding protein (TIGR01987 family)
MNYHIDISPLIKARGTFEKFRRNLGSDQEKAGAVQAFEFCYELAWKTMKRFFEKKGIDVRSPRDCFREAALNHMISDPKQWFLFIEKRNLTVHTYEEAVMEEVLQIFKDFSRALTEFIEYLEREPGREHLFLEPEDWKVFSDLVADIPCKIYAFGSRVKGTHKKFSDIDLYLVGKISDEELIQLKQRFEESTLPMKVEIKRQGEVSDSFLERIKDDLFLIKA